MAERHIYKITFQGQGKVYEIYARKVSHGTLLGFVEVEQLDFGQKQRIVLDPSEERIKAEFEGVKRTYLRCTASCASTRSTSAASPR